MNEENRNTQTFLAGGGINEEEKLRQTKKAEMQKRYRLMSFALIGIIIVSVLVYLFAAQKCLVFGHKWQAATCTTARTCTVCAAVDGKALGHDWQTATCTTAKTCASCSAIDGTALGHDWQAATCTSPQICASCSAINGAALGHDWQAATCTSPKTCASCSATDGTALGHNWPTDDELAYCIVCDHPNGKIVNASNDLLASSWTDQTVEFSLKNGKTVGCTVLLPNSTVEKCYSITLCLRINELTAGNVVGEWGFYIRDLNGQWHLADTFVLDDDYYVEAHFEFDEPISFDAWACPCHVLGDYWDFNFSVWLQDAAVFEYNG